MTDIEFDQIRAGQTVRVHYGYSDSDTKATAEGVVASIEPVGGLLRPRLPGGLVLGTGHGRALPADARITRVELLAERAPKWKVGQLAEIDWSSSGCAGATRKWLARWDGEAWVVLDEGVRLSPHWDGEPRLMTAVPADSRVVAQDAVVLPLLDGTGRRWSAVVLRAWARWTDDADRGLIADSLHIIANAIEEAQR